MVPPWPRGVRLAVIAIASLLAASCAPVATTFRPLPSEGSPSGSPTASASATAALASASPRATGTVGPPPTAGPATTVRNAIAEGSSIGQVAWKGGRFILVGSEGYMAPLHPTIWTSIDGRAWTVAWSMECAGSFTGATATAARFVAVGICDTADGHTRFVAATSPDGRAWVESVVRSPELSTQSEGDGAVEEVVAGHDGLLAVASGLGTGFTFFSSDGRTWGTTAKQSGWPTWEVAASGTTFLVLAHPADDTTLARLSDTGWSDWQAIPVPDGLWAVAGQPTGFTGLGGDGRTWTSTNGLGWSAAGFTPAGLTRTVPAAGIVVGLGAGDAEGVTLRAWLRTGGAWAPYADLAIDEQHLSIWAANAASGQLVVVAEHAAPNPVPNNYVPPEIVAWLVPLP